MVNEGQLVLSIVICIAASVISNTTSVYVIAFLVIGIIIIKYIFDRKNKTKPLKRKAILGLGGSFNPIHKQHICVLNEIKNHFENNENIEIIAAFLVITTDDYVYTKLSNEAIKYSHRYKLCQLSIKDFIGQSDKIWLYPSHYPSVSSSKYMRDIRKNGYLPLNIDADDELMIIQCMGADKEYVLKEMNKSINNDDSMDKHVCVIGRKGSCFDLKKEIEKSGKGYGNYFTAGDKFTYLDMQLENVSSTDVRKNMQILAYSKRTGEDFDTFRKDCGDMLHEKAIEYIIKHIDELWMK